VALHETIEVHLAHLQIELDELRKDIREVRARMGALWDNIDDVRESLNTRVDQVRHALETKIEKNRTPAWGPQK
jgi:hypothetical protein